MSNPEDRLKSLKKEAEAFRSKDTETAGAEESAVLEQKDGENDPYSAFTREENEEVIRNLTEYYSGQGVDLGDKEINFPTEAEEIEDFVFEQMKHLPDKYLIVVAKNNSEFAPKLTRELADRKKFSELEQVLTAYGEQNPTTFEACVSEIEFSLKNNELRDTILMALSAAMEKTTKGKEPKRIAEHEDGMKERKKTARPLSEYQRLLQMNDGEIQNLDGKNLLLVGGGLSPIKGDLAAKNVDCSVTNIDPIAEPNPENADRVVKGDFFETPLAEDEYDEIIALHSLPTYAFTPEQVRDFYDRSISTLKPNGVLRVTPVDGFSDSFTPSMRLSRKPVNNASVEYIKRLEARPDLFVVKEFTIKQKGAMGQERKLPGVKIEVVGGKEQIKAFLKSKK